MLGFLKNIVSMLVSMALTLQGMLGISSPSISPSNISFIEESVVQTPSPQFNTAKEFYSASTVKEELQSEPSDYSISNPNSTTIPSTIPQVVEKLTGVTEQLQQMSNQLNAAPETISSPIPDPQKLWEEQLRENRLKYLEWKIKQPNPTPQIIYIPTPIVPEQTATPIPLPETSLIKIYRYTDWPSTRIDVENERFMITEIIISINSPSIYRCILSTGNEKTTFIFSGAGSYTINDQTKLLNGTFQKMPNLQIGENWLVCDSDKGIPEASSYALNSLIGYGEKTTNWLSTDKENIQYLPKP